MPWISERANEISAERLQVLMEQTVAEARRRICAKPKRVLLLPPDITRMHSGAGRLTEMLYRLLASEADVHVIPTLGQHVPHTPEENRQMFGSIPNERIHAHDWRGGCVEIGQLSGRFVDETMQGAADWPLPIVLNRMLMKEPWDLIINVGHVVPHEVLGFANHNKNYFIGLGGKDLICAAHMAAASCGIENNLGNLITPLRACFNRAEEEFLSDLPDLYVQVVLARNDRDQLVHTGVHVGDDLETYLAAARQSREQNITLFDEPVQKIVCVMQGDEFFSTWVANKSIYRTRMALADGGELLVIAPGLKRFGEQPEVDEFIRKYGYVGTPRVMEQYQRNADMQDLAHATAHLMHGSSEGRFTITYAPGHLSQREIEGVNFKYADINEAIARYRPNECKQGWNTTSDGERYYFIPTPSAGLWATREKLFNRPSGFEED
ncbi:MAG TPA: lactate racemase domain-containing protein [Lacipirellulaceae bacterium]|jgi:nickel-dependent lactate racemase|nr:lactate racemase domain-containing protein [Lacipirellulaceae bacterium]